VLEGGVERSILAESKTTNPSVPASTASRSVFLIGPGFTLVVGQRLQIAE
jgi:hypothetical protein